MTSLQGLVCIDDQSAVDVPNVPADGDPGYYISDLVEFDVSSKPQPQTSFSQLGRQPRSNRVGDIPAELMFAGYYSDFWIPGYMMGTNSATTNPTWTVNDTDPHHLYTMLWMMSRGLSKGISFQNGKSTNVSFEIGTSMPMVQRTMMMLGKPANASVLSLDSAANTPQFRAGAAPSFLYINSNTVLTWNSGGGDQDIAEGLQTAVLTMASPITANFAYAQADGQFANPSLGQILTSGLISFTPGSTAFTSMLMDALLGVDGTITFSVSNDVFASSTFGLKFVIEEAFWKDPVTMGRKKLNEHGNFELGFIGNIQSITSRDSVTYPDLS